jgi:ferritin-like metal-binding protein YciE
MSAPMTQVAAARRQPNFWQDDAFTRYGTLIAWATQLGYEEVVGLLRETLIEDENTDEALSELAEDAINPQAAA